MKKFTKNFFKITFALSLGITFLNAQDDFPSSGFDGLIINENAVLGICGEFPYERDPRNCLQENTDLKLCLHLNKVNPRFKRTLDNSVRYSCINSSSSGGAEVIKEVLEESESRDGCLARNVRSFYEELIQSEDFRELSREFEGQLGKPLLLNFAIDTRDQVASLQLDLNEVTDSDQVKKIPAINLVMARLDEEGACASLDREKILGKVTEEFSRLSMIQSRQQYDPLQQAGFERPAQQVYDSNRFSLPKESETSALSRETASEKVNVR